MLDERYIIDTPENIEFDYDIAGIGSRFLAAIIDTFLIGIAEGVIFLLLGLLANQINLLDSSGMSDSILAGLAGFLAFVILWSYYIIFEVVWNGQSPGKRLVGLRVVRDGGRPLTFMSSALRNFIRLVDLLPGLYGIGVVSMFVDRHARRLGDLAAGTLVVKERRDVSLESLSTGAAAALPIDAPTDRQAPTFANVHMIQQNDYELIQEFLNRRESLGRDARLRLGMQLASGMQTRLGLPVGGDAERFLQYLVVEYQLYQRQLSEAQK